MGFKEYFAKIIKSDGFDATGDYYLYGLGTTGRVFADLCDIYGVKLSGIVVGDGYRKSDVYKNYPVYTLSEMPSGDISLLYSVKQDIASVKRLLSNEIRIINIGSVGVYWDLLDMWYGSFFEERKKSVLFHDELIDFNGCRILNPRMVNNREWTNFLQEAGDILLPELFDIYDRVDEGSYEVENVTIEKDDIVVDAGANCGIFSALAAYRGAKKCYSFEPMSANIEYLKKQASEYPECIVPETFALSDENKKMQMSVDGSSSSLYESGDSLDKEWVQSITLDEFIRRENVDRIDFIKADIEGAECAMLRGAADVLKRFAPKLAICTYHRPTDKDELTRIIKRANPDYIIEYRWKKLYAYVKKGE